MKDINKLKKLKLCVVGLGVLTSLTACDDANKIELAESELVYSEDTAEFTGKIAYEDLDKIRILNFRQSGVDLTRAVIYDEVYYLGGRVTRAHTEVNYIDIKTDTTFIQYRQYKEEAEKIYVKGEDIVITNEEPVTSYVLKTIGVKKTYGIDEIMGVCDEVIKQQETQTEDALQAKKVLY